MFGFDELTTGGFDPSTAPSTPLGELLRAGEFSPGDLADVPCSDNSLFPARHVVRREVVNRINIVQILEFNILISNNISA
jgi:hypothetical protein